MKSPLPPPKKKENEGGISVILTETKERLNSKLVKLKLQWGKNLKSFYKNNPLFSQSKSKEYSPPPKQNNIWGGGFHSLNFGIMLRSVVQPMFFLAFTCCEEFHP